MERRRKIVLPKDSPDDWSAPAWVFGKRAFLVSSLLALFTVVGSLTFLRYGSLVDVVVLRGSLEPARTARIAYRRSGVIARVWAHPGTRVEAGQVLVELESEDLSRLEGMVRSRIAAVRNQGAVVRSLAALSVEDAAQRVSQAEHSLARARAQSRMVEVEFSSQSRDQAVLARDSGSVGARVEIARREAKIAESEYSRALLEQRRAIIDDGGQFQVGQEEARLLREYRIVYDQIASSSIRAIEAGLLLGESKDLVVGKSVTEGETAFELVVGDAWHLVGRMGDKDIGKLSIGDSAVIVFVGSSDADSEELRGSLVRIEHARPESPGNLSNSSDHGQFEFRVEVETKRRANVPGGEWRRGLRAEVRVLARSKRTGLSRLFRELCASPVGKYLLNGVCNLASSSRPI